MSNLLIVVVKDSNSYRLESWLWWNSCRTESEAGRACVTVQSLDRGPSPKGVTRLRHRLRKRHCHLLWRRWRKIDHHPNLPSQKTKSRLWKKRLKTRQKVFNLPIPTIKLAVVVKAWKVERGFEKWIQMILSRLRVDRVPPHANDNTPCLQLFASKRYPSHYPQ